MKTCESETQMRLWADNNWWSLLIVAKNVIPILWRYFSIIFLNLKSRFKLCILVALPGLLSTNLFNKTTNFNRRLLGERLIYTTKLYIYNKKTVKIHLNKLIIKQNEIKILKNHKIINKNAWFIIKIVLKFKYINENW